MHKVTFKFENSEDVTVFAAFGESLLEVARKTNVAIDAPCGGNGACGKCKVKLMGGTLDSKKTSHISDEEYAAGWRLACISKIIDDVEVLVPDIASAYKSRMKMADLSSAEEVKIFEELKEQIAEVGIELKNNLEVIDVTMSAPTLDDTMRIMSALHGLWKRLPVWIRSGCLILSSRKWHMFSVPVIFM